jgi:5-methylcytosine-specific restriction enzyme A
VSWRTKPLPKGWHKLQPRILRRDNHQCQLRYDVCIGKATEVDHIHGPDDDSDANLQAACPPCHRVKTSREARAANPLSQPRRRQPEPHPGATP